MLTAPRLCPHLTQANFGEDRQSLPTALFFVQSVLLFLPMGLDTVPDSSMR